MVAGAWGAGIFIKPREFKAAMTPEEEEAPTADWIKRCAASRIRRTSRSS
jgi:hypothetical protein